MIVNSTEEYDLEYAVAAKDEPIFIKEKLDEKHWDVFMSKDELDLFDKKAE